MAPGLFYIILVSYQLANFCCRSFTLQYLLSVPYIKNTKNITLPFIISIRSHVANNREGIDNPLSRWVQGWCLFMQVFGDLSVVSYWIDTLVLKN